ncbi:MAG: hypothetical protein MMC33_008042 [Icmadophila ericetorum]|nr:hypothetical protein [Icmadophila ericetorum]
MTLIIGKEGYMRTVPIKAFSGSITFVQLLSNDRWPEARHCRIQLEDDDINAWDKALEFATTGELVPNVLPRTEPCGDSAHILPSTTHWHTDREDLCITLDPPIQAMSQEHQPVPFHCTKYQFGDWILSDDHQQLFKILVDLYFLADKYLWQELLEAALSRIPLFPIGPDAFAVLAARWHDLCPEDERKTSTTLNPDLDWVGGLKERFQEFVVKAFRYHSHAMDTSDAFPDYSDSVFI